MCCVGTLLEEVDSDVNVFQEEEYRKQVRGVLGTLYFGSGTLVNNSFILIGIKLGRHLWVPRILLLVKLSAQRRVLHETTFLQYVKFTVPLDNVDEFLHCGVRIRYSMMTKWAIMLRA